jgi:hypothetical protein
MVQYASGPELLLKSLQLLSWASFTCGFYPDPTMDLITTPAISPQLKLNDLGYSATKHMFVRHRRDGSSKQQLYLEKKNCYFLLVVVDWLVVIAFGALYGGFFTLIWLA